MSKHVLKTEEFLLYKLTAVALHRSEEIQHLDRSAAGAAAAAAAHRSLVELLDHLHKTPFPYTCAISW